MFDPLRAKDVHRDRKLLRIQLAKSPVLSPAKPSAFLLGVLLVNPRAHLCAVTRAGIEVTKPIPATDNVLHNILENYLYSSKEDKGIDSHLERRINVMEEIRVKVKHDQIATQAVSIYFD